MPQNHTEFQQEEPTNGVSEEGYSFDFHLSFRRRFFYPFFQKNAPVINYKCSKTLSLRDSIVLLRNLKTYNIVYQICPSLL